MVARAIFRTLARPGPSQGRLALGTVLVAIVSCTTEPPKAAPGPTPLLSPTIMVGTAPPSAAPSSSAAPGPCPRGMAQVPGGKFRMGSDTGSDDEKPAHEVAVGTFCMDVMEVTVAAFRACVAAGKCQVPDHSTVTSLTPQCNWGKSGREDHPVTCASFTDAKGYCAFAGKRLPTEEEWEFAARGTDQRIYPWGNEAPSNQACWNREGTCPVGSFPSGASPFGLLDMAGNVTELTSGLSCFYAGAPESCTPWQDISTRGGSFSARNPDGLRANARNGASRDDRYPHHGFRCASSDTPPPSRVFPANVMYVCECFKKAYAQPSCEVRQASEAIGGVNEDCIRTYANDCGNMIACSRGEPGAAPKCLPGYGNWGAMRMCAKKCKKDSECGPGQACSKEWGMLCTPKD